MNKSLSTGQVAGFCGVDYRTVSRWIREGYLRAFTLPGRGDHRVPITECVRFLRSNEIPVPPELAASCESTRILVVEDDRDILENMKTTLEDAGYEVVTAEDGFSAGAELMNFRPVLMILDLRLPRLDGLQVLEYVQKTPELKTTRVLVVTGIGKERLQEALDAGADAGLEKPFRSHQLLEKVAELVG